MMAGPRLANGDTIEQRIAYSLARVHRCLSDFRDEVEGLVALTNKLSVKADQLATSNRLAGDQTKLPGNSRSSD
jgi:hypothetical protein